MIALVIMYVTVLHAQVSGGLPAIGSTQGSAATAAPSIVGVAFAKGGVAFSATPIAFK
jgi:hypothetical protein